ncbi:MAG: DUF3795 domain-containing protein [Spirochaetes bacterium]|nr:DUF3795 domain-containing protein [Spirochaetota bacterium]
MNKNLAAPCGLYCGACGVYIATAEKNEKIREKFSKAYGSPLSETHCTGCLSDNPDDIFMYCKVCPIKTCAREKGLEGCFQCDEFPCVHIERFPSAEGKKVLMEAVPRWKQLGTEKWLKDEARRYTCKSCGAVLYRGARFCRNCRTPFAAE